MGFYDETPSERAFREGGPFYHLYTKPLETEVFFETDEDRKVAVNYLAIAVSVSNCKLLAYAIMTNHFHFVLEGCEEDILEFYERFSAMMDNYFRYHGKGTIMRQAAPGLTAINNLSQLRTEIAYVLRNPFVVMSDVNVFSYPWTSGFLYFNPLLERKGVSASTMSVRTIRDITKSRLVSDIDPSVHFADGVAQGWSFVDYRRVEEFYDNARQFVFSVVRNVESQVETALRYGETPVLCDEELIPKIYQLCREKFRADSLSALDNKGRKQLAVIVKNKYHSSNKQIARLVKLPLADVNVLFPLAAPSKQCR
ncbi:MAG: hypothetical protein IJU21_04320 [Bacteroidales bacterium]|nr:hypothetical protein [Bacteroidales bacterium]